MGDDRAPDPGSDHGVRSVLPGLIGLSVVVAFSLWRGRPVVAGVAVVAAFVLLQLAAVRPSWARRVTRLIERVGHGLGVALSIVVLGVVWLVVIVPVSLLNRVFGIDLLEHGGPHGWHVVGGAERARRPYRREQRTSGQVGRRLLRLSAVVLVLGVVTAAVVDRANTVRPPPVTPFGERATNQATGIIYHDRWVTYHGTPVSRHLFPGEPWGAEVLAIHDRQPPCDAVNVQNMHNPTNDLTSDYVNVVDGGRLTLRVARPERTVWMFGGSTTYGVGQRDEHTIASDLVRLAAAGGVRLEVVNLGCPGKLNWSETLQFEDLLRSGVTPPDVALFFDGINEWDRAFTREIVGLLDPDVPFPGYASQADQDALLAAAQERGYVETHDQGRQMRLTAAQYRLGVQRARVLGREFDVPVVHFWQPALFTMPVSAPGNATVYDSDEIDPASAMVAGQRYEQAAVLSGVGPIDLTDVLDDAAQPLFFDCCHTNEAGARLQAEAIYPHLADALAR